jgi:hypothetical protein
MPSLAETILYADQSIRLVAVCRDGWINMIQRAGAFETELDRYEEAHIIPALLDLTDTRGRIRGGRDYHLVRYGNFFQIVYPISAGHVSIVVDPDGDPIEMLQLLRPLCENQCLIDGGSPSYV